MCLFCLIAQGRVPSETVYSSERVVAFLDIQPIRPGHVQIVPREHFPYFEDLPLEVATEILAVGQRLARVLKQRYDVPRVAFLFTGGDIAHAHAHVVPMVSPTDITSTQYIVERPLSFQATPRASAAELHEVGEALRTALA